MIRDLALKTALTVLCLMLVLGTPVALGAQQQNTGNGPTAAQIVQKLLEKNEDRASKLQHYTGTRHYHLEYRGLLGQREAAMDVEATFDAPAAKSFRVVSQSGSKIFISRVLMKLLDSEKEALNEDNRRKTMLSPENYAFELAGMETNGAASYYILKVEPRNDNKFLYRGKIWIDSRDFAVARIEAEPAKNPSFWTKKTDIHQQYTKVGEFWLPQQNKTVTVVRIGGVATLQIDYQDYAVNTNVAASHTARPSRTEGVMTTPVSDVELANSFAK